MIFKREKDGGFCYSKTGHLLPGKIMGRPWASLILWKFHIAIKEISATVRIEHSEERAQQAEVREHRLCGGCQHRTVISSTGGETLRAEGGLFSVLGMHVVKDTENREGWGSG